MARSSWIGLAVVCSSWLLTLPSAAGEAERIVVSGAGARAVAYPAQPSAEKKAPVVYLHGICGAPDRGCDAFAAEATRLGPFVCPMANTRCEGGSHSWGGSASNKLDTVDRAMALVAERTSGALDVGRAGILVGFSQGAYAAMQLIEARPGRFRGLYLVGAKVQLQPEKLLAIGVTRVVLAAGRYDGTFAAMRDAVHAVGEGKRGFEARFVDLGAVGHTYEAAADRNEAVHEAWAWLDAADEVAD